MIAVVHSESHHANTHPQLNLTSLLYEKQPSVEMNKTVLKDEITTSLSILATLE